MPQLSRKKSGLADKREAQILQWSPYRFTNQAQQEWVKRSKTLTVVDQYRCLWWCFQQMEVPVREEKRPRLYQPNVMTPQPEPLQSVTFFSLLWSVCTDRALFICILKRRNVTPHEKNRRKRIRDLYSTTVITEFCCSGVIYFWRGKKCKELGTHTKVPSHQRLSIVSWITCDGWDLWIRICITRFTTF